MPKLETKIVFKYHNVFKKCINTLLVPILFSITDKAAIYHTNDAYEGKRGKTNKKKETHNIIYGNDKIRIYKYLLLFYNEYFTHFSIKKALFISIFAPNVE